MANYLVTGAAGFIGASLASRLISEGHSVVTIDNLSTGFEDNIPSGVCFIQGDCADESVYSKLPNLDYSAIIHVAGQSSGEISFDDPIYDIRTNAESTLLLLTYASRIGCSRFIFASTMSVYGIQPDAPVPESSVCAPESFYGVAKFASESYLKIYQQFGISSTSLRLFNVYGAGQNMANLRQGMISIYLAQVLNNNHIHVMGAPDRFRDFIYIDDVVEAFVRCLASEESKNKVINIGTGQKRYVRDVVELLLTNFPESTVEYSGNTAGDVYGVCACTKKMNEVLGEWPKVDLSRGLRLMIDAYR